MIVIDVNGEHPTLSREEIFEVFFWGISELMPRKQNLEVTIDILDLSYDDVTGYHSYSDHHLIELDVHQSEPDFITALFHELVHVRQTERGMCFDDETPYYERRTEIEAYHLQEELYTKWKSSLQLH